MDTKDLKIKIYNRFSTGYIDYVSHLNFEGENISVEDFAKHCDELGLEVSIEF